LVVAPQLLRPLLQELVVVLLAELPLVVPPLQVVGVLQLQSL
jgi:hypothetical protein